jgi:rubrerythrin
MSAESKRLIPIFEYALQQENTGLNFFQGSISRLGDSAAVSAFKRLVDEEKTHIQFISGILSDLKSGGKVDVPTLEKFVSTPGNFFEERARSELLERSLEGSMVPDMTVFNTAWLIEKDVSEFYANMATKAEASESKKAFEMLAAWEKTHEKLFRDFRDRLFAEYSAMPWGG